MDSIGTSSDLIQPGSGTQEHIAPHILQSPDEFGLAQPGVEIETGTQSTTSSSGQTSADRSYEIISIPTTPSVSTSTLPPSPPPPTPGKRDLAIAIDGSYVETTSATAARVLAKFYSEQDGGGKGKEEYVVVSRQEGGKTFWRIRPRSRPTREEVPVPQQTSKPSAARPSVPPLLFPSLSSPTSKAKKIPTPPPTLTFQQPTPVKSSTAARQWRNLRSSKSIPVLRNGIIPIATPLPRSPKISEESHSLALASRQQLSPLPVMRSTTKGETFRRLRRIGSTPILSNEVMRSDKKSVTTRVEKGKGRELEPSRGDILGNLLGWNAPAGLKGEAATQTSPRERETLMRRDAAFLPTHSFLATTSILPFHFPAKSTDSTSPLSSPQGQSEARHMREVASSDSIRTAKADDDPVRTVPFRKRFQDPAIFDLFQSESLSSTTSDGHHRIPSRSSSTSDMFRSDPHLISVPSKETDDPRFVLWEYKDSAPSPSLRSPTSPSRSATARRGSVEGGASSSSMSGGSPATGSSRRWSLNGRKPFGGSTSGGGETSSPATSVRDSIGSVVGLNLATAKSSPSTKVLLAATVERLVAELTSKIEVELLSGFFLTYRTFVRPLDLLRLLITRFEWAMLETNSPEDEAGRRIVRVRTFVVLRHWLLNHFADDFIPERKLRTTLTDWLNAASKDDRTRASPKDMRLIKGLKKLVRKLKELHVALGPDDTEAAARALAGSQLDEVGGAVRPTGEEDVDLELEGTRISPANLAPAPTSAIASATIPFLSKKTNKPQALTSPPTTFEVPPPQLHSPSSNPNFPLPNSQNPISRSVTSALGTFGRFKRMLGNRTNHAPVPTFGTCASSEAFDEVEFEENATGDLLWVKGGLERYLAYYDISKSEDTAVELQTTQEEASPVEKVVGGLGIVSTFDLEKEDYVAINKPSFIPAFKPYPPKSILSRVSHGGPSKLALPSAPYGAGDHSPDIFFLQPRPTSVRIELDDVDLSDEDDDVVEVKRTLKRLPGAQNLRQAITLQNLVQSGVSRHSFDSVSSYGSPQGRPSLMSRGSMVDSEGGDLPEGVQVVPNFVLEGIDSDDEEPGDVEAALRRLEGIVDDGKEAAKAHKVAKQMEKSRQLEILKMSLVSVEDDASNAPPLNPATDRASNGPLSGSLSSSITQSTIASLPSVPESDDSPRQSHNQPKREAVLLEGPISLIPPDRQISESGGLSPSARRPVSSTQHAVPRKPSFSKLFTITSRPPSARPSAGIAPPTHRSFLLTCRTEVLAQQFCLIERDMLRVLGWQELVVGTWRDRSNAKEVVDWELYLKERRIVALKARQKGDRSGSGVEAVIARFNLTANWVCSEIVLTASIEDRVALISKFIRLAFKCYCQSNFQTLAQIIYGLQSEDLERLRKTWDRVPTWEMRKFRNMQLFVSHLKNFKLLREVTDCLISEYGPPGQRGTSNAVRSPSVRGGKAPTPTGCIPFLGLYLSDLTSNAKLPTFLDPTCTTSPANIDVNGSLISTVDPLTFTSLPPLPPQTTLQPLVNLQKFRTMASVVQRVLAFQEFAEGYPYTPEQGVYFKCLKIRCLAPGFIRECSFRMAQE